MDCKPGHRLDGNRDQKRGPRVAHPGATTHFMLAATRSLHPSVHQFSVTPLTANGYFCRGCESQGFPLLGPVHPLVDLEHSDNGQDHPDNGGDNDHPPNNRPRKKKRRDLCEPAIACSFQGNEFTETLTQNLVLVQLERMLLRLGKLAGGRSMWGLPGPGRLRVVGKLMRCTHDAPL